MVLVRCLNRTVSLRYSVQLVLRDVMKLRSATILDAKAIAEIHAKSWQSTYNNVLTKHYLSSVVPKERNDVWHKRLINPKPNQHVVVAEYDNELIGFACAFAAENATWGSYLDNLHVRQSFRRKGIGKALLLDVAHWCFDREPNKGLCLLVNQDNINAQQFYNKFGARNAQVDVWNAPDGSVVPTFWFVWDQLHGVVGIA